MRLNELDLIPLLDAANEIPDHNIYKTIPKTGGTEAQLRTQPIEGTVLSTINIAENCPRSTIGGLACDTGIPVKLLHDVITKTRAVAENGDVARNRLLHMLIKLAQPEVAKAA